MGDNGEGLVYCGPMVYRRNATGVLSFESADICSGRITASGVRYHVKDHLGSIRGVVRGEDGALLKCTDYDLYGACVSGPLSTVTNSESIRYYFSGKEDQSVEFSIPYTDFGARHYSPALRRWMVPDSKSEDYYDISPYAYCAGDSVNIIDPNGQTILIYDNDAKQMVKYTQGELFNIDGSVYQGENSFVCQVRDILNSLIDLKDGYITHVISTLETDPENNYYFAYKEGYKDSTRAVGDYGESLSNEGLPVGAWMMFSLKKDTIDGVENNSMTTIAHEISHSYDYNKGLFKGENPWKGNGPAPTEIRAVNFENRVRVRTGMQKRTKYNTAIPKNQLENPWAKKRY